MIFSKFFNLIEFTRKLLVFVYNESLLMCGLHRIEGSFILKFLMRLCMI